MSVLTQVLGAAINLLMTPFGPAPIGLVGQPVKPDSNYCAPRILQLGENQMKISLIPRGYCPNCCPIRSGIDVRFMFYSKTNFDRGGINIEHKSGSAKTAGVNATSPTVIFIHGFTEPSPGQNGRAITEAYLGRPENFNVILLDWSNLATFPWYLPATRNVKYVSESLKNFVEIFNDSGEIPIANVHLVGFSLGSHIAGFAGKRLKSGLKIPRITALDPAFPEFATRDASRRLTRTDAEYIDVIHTDSGILGLPIPVGHADFYPNGGRALQPGCQPGYLVRLRLMEQVFACSHVRAWKLFAESIRNPEAFPATKCRLWRGPDKKCNFTMDGMMGFPNNKRSQGQFYLITNFKAPYAKTVTQQRTDLNLK